MTNEREPHDPLPSRFDEDDDGAEIGSDSADATGTTNSALPGTFSPRRARREQDELDSAPGTPSVRTPSAGSPSAVSPPSETAPSRLASEAKFAWGLTPRVPVSNDEAAGRSTVGADDAASSVEPGTPTENDVSRDGPASATRPFYPPPPVRSSDFDAPAAAPEGVVAPAAAVTPDPAISDPAASDPAPVDSSPLPIPTIEQVLDAPSPRRAAREAAAREEAARAAGTLPPAPGDATSAALPFDRGIPPLTEPAIAAGRVRAPEIDPSATGSSVIDPSAAHPSATERSVERSTSDDDSAVSTPSSEIPGPSMQPADTTTGSGLDALFGDPDGGEGEATTRTAGFGSEIAADDARTRHVDQAALEPGDPKPPMATRQKVLIGVVILLLLALVVVVLLAVGRMSTTTAAPIPTFGWAASIGLPPV